MDLSVGMAVTTFGIVIYTICNNLAFRQYERLKNDYDVLFDEILKTKKWIRWPFLKRKEILKLPKGNTMEITLTNPPINFTIGKKDIKIDVPTTYEDMFDLPLSNYFELRKHKEKFMDQVFSKKQTHNKKYMSYSCLHDMWKSIFYFRILRYFVYLGILLIATGAIIIVDPIGLLFTALP